MNNSNLTLGQRLTIVILCLPFYQMAWSQQSVATEATPNSESENVTAAYEVPTDSESPQISQAELDQLLSPVALYPDTVLSHILVATTYPLEVVQAARWSKNNDNPEGSAALDAVETKDWAPSVKALVQFPDVIQKMSEDLDWMQTLGDAFLQNEAAVLATVQNLRQQARSQGSLDNTQHLQVIDNEGDIIIEPVTKEVVYVPYYDTRVVYGPWWWSGYPPIHWQFARHSHRFHLGNPFYWGTGIYVGTGIYFSSFHWRNRHVVVVDYNRRHHYSYRGGRSLHRHVDSRRWRHNPRHRRGVIYRSNHVRHNAFSKRHRAPYRRNHSSREVAQRLRERSERARNNNRHANSPREQRQYRNRDRRDREARQNHHRREQHNARQEQRASRDAQRERGNSREGQRNQRNYREGQSHRGERSAVNRQARANNLDQRRTSKASSSRGYDKLRKAGKQRNVRNTRASRHYRTSGRRSEGQRAHRTRSSSGQRSRSNYQRR